MRRILLALTIGVSGCTQYAQVQMNLAAEARKGVAMCEKSHDTYAKVIETLHSAQRARLDDGFDEDVRAQQALSADWILAHRRAYAAAIEALDAEQQQLRQANDTDLRNLKAIDRALAELYLLESIQAKWMDVLKTEGGTNDN